MATELNIIPTNVTTTGYVNFTLTIDQIEACGFGRVFPLSVERRSPSNRWENIPVTQCLKINALGEIRMTVYADEVIAFSFDDNPFKEKLWFSVTKEMVSRVFHTGVVTGDSYIDSYPLVNGD